MSTHKLHNEIARLDRRIAALESPGARRDIAAEAVEVVRGGGVRATVADVAALERDLAAVLHQHSTITLAEWQRACSTVGRGYLDDDQVDDRDAALTAGDLADFAQAIAARFRETTP